MLNEGRSWPNLLWPSFLAVCGLTSMARGSTIVVPDQAPTIQAAINTGADTVFIIPATYLESPIVWRPLVMIGAPSPFGGRPQLDALQITPAVELFPERYDFQSLTTVGPVVIQNEIARAELSFGRCELRSGITDVSSSDRTWRITLDHCEMLGLVELYALDSCLVDSCRIGGGVQCSGLSTTRLTVANSIFEGSGTGYGIEALGIASYDIRSNIIGGYGIGASLRAEGNGSLTWNRVEACYGPGITVRAFGRLEVFHNAVRDCGQGIQVNGEDVVASDNTVDSCIARDALWHGHGMRVDATTAVVERNIVWGCDGDGLTVGFLGGVGSRIANNTSCLNLGSGIVSSLNVLGDGGTTEFVANVGWSNNGWGMSWLQPPEGRASTVACNDWFANGAGDVGGTSPSPEDLGVDPQFCNPTRGDFHLLTSSPLAAWPGCDLIGAMGMGCGLTGTVVVRFTANWKADGVEILWELGNVLGAEETWIERADESSRGPWLRPTTERSREGQAVVEMDRTAVGGRTYWYRLLLREEGSTRVAGGPIAVGAAEPMAFRLIDVSPNPASGAVRIEFAVPHRSRIEIGVFDVQGRTVTSLADGEWPAGKHVFMWAGLGCPPGWYVIRYRFPGGQETMRLVRAR